MSSTPFPKGIAYALGFVRRAVAGEPQEILQRAAK
jgi:hypothetical protein